MSINQYLRALETGSYVKDFAHASRVFRTDSFALHPKFQFLYYVRINLSPYLALSDPEANKVIGALAKTVTMPRFTFDTKTLNAYNRPNLVQTKIKYDPVSIRFHDDGADVIRNFWYDYYSYHYRDSDYASNVTDAPHKYQIRQSDAWGYELRSEPDSFSEYEFPTQFIKSIQIYSFHKKKFNEITLHNPIVQSFNHGTHEFAQGAGIMEHEMSFQYETVSYASGYLTGENFGDDMLRYYDNVPGSIIPWDVGGNPNVDMIEGPNGYPRSAPSVVDEYSRGSTMNPAGLMGAMGGSYPGIGGAMGAMGGGASTGTASVLGKVGLGIAGSMVGDLLRGRKPNTKLNAPNITNLLYQAGSLAGGQAGAGLIAAGGLVRAGSAIAKGGIGPGNLGTAVVAIKSIGSLTGLIGGGGSPGAVSSNGGAVGGFLKSAGINIPSFPSLGSKLPSPNYGSGGVQTIPTPATTAAYTGNYSYSPESMNDAADSGSNPSNSDQGSFNF